METTELTVIERAKLAVGSAKHEAQLIDLAEGAKAIVSITNVDGYKEAHATRMTLKNARLAISKTGKAARDDATAFAKSVIEEEKRLIAIIEPDEERINTLQEQWDAAIEAEKQRKIAEEAARVEAIKAKIEAFRRAPLDAVGKSSDDLRKAIDDLDAMPVDESFAEHLAYAAMVKGDATKALSSMLLGAMEAEAEQARIIQERAELEALREQQRIADAERAEAEMARLNAERDEAHRKEYAAREALRIQQEESARLAAELAALRKANDDRVAAEKKAEEDRVAKELRVEAQRIADEEQAAEQRAAGELEAANRMAQAVSQQEEESRIAQSIPDLAEVSVVGIERPSDDEIINVIADHFDVSTETAIEWITSISSFHQFAAELRAA